MLPWTGLATVGAIGVCLFTAFVVSRARKFHGVRAPATTGHPQFERRLRVQQNSLEQIVVFLPARWMAALVVGDLPAAGLGVVWIIGRILYARSYHADPATRAPGFIITLAASLLLLLATLFGIVRALLGA